MLQKSIIEFMRLGTAMFLIGGIGGLIVYLWSPLT